MLAPRRLKTAEGRLGGIGFCGSGGTGAVRAFGPVNLMGPTKPTKET